MRCFSRHGVIGASVVAFCAATGQSAIMIEFTGMDLVYDGSSFHDGGSSSGGFADPADADGLVSVDFFEDGVLVGSLSSDIWLDFMIPDVSALPSAPGTVHNLVTPGNPGYFDLLMGTSPLASEFLLLDISSVTITYIDIAGVVEFAFGAAIAPLVAQNLPFGLVAGEPVTLSFSSQVTPGSLTSSGGFITGFQSYGTGEFTAVPTPGAMALMGLAGVAGVRRRQR